MYTLRILGIRNFAILILVLIFSASAYAFAAVNTVNNSQAGEGTGSINPYTITNIKYTLDNNDPSQIRSVQFDVSPTGGSSLPSEVQARVNSSAWVNCSGGPVTRTCFFSAPYPAVSASPPPALQVVAAQ